MTRRLRQVERDVQRLPGARDWRAADRPQRHKQHLCRA
jgi:hypothetical protein